MKMEENEWMNDYIWKKIIYASLPKIEGCFVLFPFWAPLQVIYMKVQPLLNNMG
jgi:hypothetical protein